MCARSVVTDDFNDRIRQRPFVTDWQTFPRPTGPTKAEFDELKKEVQELKKLLAAAKRFDAATGQKDCEEESKQVLLRKIAELVGVDLGSVLTKPKRAASRAKP